MHRRSFVRLAGIATLVALGGARAAARPALSTPDGAFVPPSGPMRYTRRLVRTLAGGQSLTVERSFEVRFVPASRGFAVVGEQIDVTVDAPTTLAALAAMERKRVERGLFPLQLDANGRIQGAPHEDARDGTDGIEQALAATRAVIERRPLSAGERAEAAQFLGLVHQSAATFLSHLPADLFVPAERHRLEERALDLPGEDGIVRVEFVAETDPRTGLMHSARREIVTEIEGQRRVTREDWTLTPL